ncbi:hypothetical protein G6701_03410 [Polynucleobacter paneuropaeus]|nr:hypothetical protein [Polynucleobacter paneuropaeus]
MPKIQGIALESIQNLNFPSLVITPNTVNFSIIKKSLDEGDKETHFQKNRWASCIEMILSNLIDEETISSISAWITSPPPKTDQAWEIYSCCERIANLSLLFGSYPLIKDRFDKDQLISFYVDNGNWIASHLEYYGLEQTNNHFFNNGRALIIAGVVLNHQAWVDTGLSIFRKFAPLLFGSDGFLREGSSHYHLVVAGWYFDGLQFARTKVNLLESDPLIRLAHLVGDACQQFSAALPDMATHIGDISPDINPKLSLARLSAIYSYWLDGGQPSPESVSPLSKEWLFIHTVKDVVIARWSKQWPVKYTTHAHADLGSFVWRHRERWILVDPGRIDYTIKGNQQLWAKSHNTLLINGVPPLAESVLSAGIWYPKFYTQAQIESVAGKEGELALTHNGFSRVIPNLIHTRKLNLMDGELKVVDKLQGSGAVKVQFIWNFSPEFVVLKNNLMGDHEVQVDLVCKDSRQLVHHAQAEQYTYSGSYGEGIPAHRMIVNCELDLPCSIETQFIVKNLLCAE